MSKTSLLVTEQQDDVLIITLIDNLGEEKYQLIEESAQKVYKELERSPHVHHVVLDLHNIEYFGSTAIGFFVGLSKRLSERDGHMALFGLSKHGQEVLQCVRLGSKWPLCNTREEAIDAVRQTDSV